MSLSTCIICAACSGVPCLRLCSFTASTLSLLCSRPSLAAKPPSSSSSTNTPGSSVRRTSLMPSCSVESRLCRVMRRLPGLPSGTAGAGTAGTGGGRALQRRSLSTVSCKVAHGRASVERAKLCGVLLMSTLFTCRKTESCNA